MRKTLFQIAYWATSILTAILALPLLIWPSRKPLMRWVRGYSRIMVFWMRVIGGIKLEVRGQQHIPAGSAIIAAKHQSWGDGFCMFSQFADLAFISGDHLDKLPLIGRILRKMGAVMVTGCGNIEDRAKVTQDGVGKARQDGRPILIYPEGRLTPVGQYTPYKKGVFHMMEAYGAPVVPVATNLGLFWPRDTWDLKPGIAVIEFLEPIAPGLGKDVFMALLHERIETASLALVPADFVVPKDRMWVDPADLKSPQRETVSA